MKIILLIITMLLPMQVGCRQIVVREGEFRANSFLSEIELSGADLDYRTTRHGKTIRLKFDKYDADHAAVEALADLAGRALGPTVVP